jgi:hypothetical protein
VPGQFAEQGRPGHLPGTGRLPGSEAGPITCGVCGIGFAAAVADG